MASRTELAKIIREHHFGNNIWKLWMDGFKLGLWSFYHTLVSNDKIDKRLFKYMTNNTIECRINYSLGIENYVMDYDHFSKLKLNILNYIY